MVANTLESTTSKLLDTVKELQERILSGERDSVVVDPDTVRLVDELDIDFGLAHILRAE